MESEIPEIYSTRKEQPKNDWLYLAYETNRLLRENNDLLRHIDEKLRIANISGYD
jgi:hypothetical protein